MPDEVTIETEQPTSTLEQNPESPALVSSGPEGRKERIAAMAAKLSPTEGSPKPEVNPVASPAPKPTAFNQEQINALIQEAVKKQQEAIRREIGLGNVLPKKLQGLPEKLATRLRTGS